MKKLVAIGLLVFMTAVCLKNPEKRAKNHVFSHPSSQKTNLVQTITGEKKTLTEVQAKKEGLEEMSFTELERDFKNLSLKELDDKILAIENSEELKTFIFNANKGSLGPEESRILVNLIRAKAVLSKLAAEKELGEVL